MVQHVAEHPSDVWLVGPFFAAVTGMPLTHGVLSLPAGSPFAMLLECVRMADFISADSCAGVAFKEGLCYGKAEAAGLFFVTPALLLSHLTGQSEPVQDVRLSTAAQRHLATKLLDATCSSGTWAQMLMPFMHIAGAAGSFHSAGHGLRSAQVHAAHQG